MEFMPWAAKLQKVRVDTMFLKYCILLAFSLDYGLCGSEKNISRQLNGTVIGNQILTRANGPYLVTSDLVVPENATLTIEPGTQVNFVPSVGIRVRGSFHAKGSSSHRITLRAVPCGETLFCNNTDEAEFYSRGIRLVDGTSHSNGRLQLQYNGQWGAICNDWSSWDFTDTQVACRHLGFLGAKRYYKYYSSRPLIIENVRCQGNEKSLWDCRYRWLWGDGSYCAYRWTVGIECDTLLPYFTEKVYWKGIYFEPTNSSEELGSSSLEHVDIVNAFVGINAMKNVPKIEHVTINDSASGFNINELAKPLTVVDSSILRPLLAGVSIESSGGNVVIENVTVQSARFGGGLVYKRLALNFCSVIPEKASFSLLLNAAGNNHPVNCTKVFRASPGRKISVHLRLIDGSGFELNITDASTAIKTQLHRITSAYNGRTIKTGFSSILIISFYSEGSSKAPANLEMIVMEDQGETVSLVISNSTFSDNPKSGITVENLIGNSRITQTTMVRNNFYGLYASNIQGKITVVTTAFLRNKYNGVKVTKMKGSLDFINVNSSKNQASGIVIDAGTLSFQMSDSSVEENAGEGLHILNQVNSTINIYNTQFSRNSNGDGVCLQALRYCYALLAEVLSLGNSQNGALFTRLSDTILNVTSCKFDGNSYTGVQADYFQRGGLKLDNISTSNNYRNGYVFHFGDTSINIESSSSFGNGRDGFYVENQEGEVILKDFAARGNKRNGLWFLDDNSARLRSVYLLNCNVSENGQYGVRFFLTYRFTQGTEDYTIRVVNSTIFNNPLGGCMLYPADCGWWGVRRQRRVRLLFTGNEVKGNKKNGLDIYGPEWYELSAVLANNIYYENSGLALRVRHGESCTYEHSSPFKLQISSSIFLKNTGEYIFFVDCGTLPTKCHVTIKNNTFLDNQRIRPFSSNYLRTKTQAVLAVKGGNVTIKYNSFINPLFSHELAALLKDHEHVVEAEENWWGTRDECKLKDRLFDFEDRVELAQIYYYPFLDSFNSTSARLHSGVRPFCFLRGDKLGGTLNQVLSITNQIDAYRVISDVTILSDGVLYIEENVTLEFPLKSVFLVQGKVIIKGTDKEPVKFLPRRPLHRDIRLVGGSAPWEGVVEIWVNRTWMPVCIRTYRHEYDIVCRQLGYEPVNSYRRDPSGKEKIFLHNIRCDTDQGDNITFCNKNNWISSSSCSAYLLYVGCKIPYWAGIHLAVTSKESIVSHVEVCYAGFPYRDDLRIPGIAFRADLLRHTIGAVSVNNSASIGYQIMYPDPVEDSYRIANSTITNTESDGIRLESPFFELLGATVANTKGYGFSYRYNWNALNTHVVKMADASVKKFMDMCSESAKFIDDSSVVHYLVVTANSKAACEAIITVPKEYTIGLQLIYHDVHSVVFHVYNRKEKPNDINWDIHMLDWYSRPVWMSGNSSILLEKGSNYYPNDYVVHFLLFLIKTKSCVHRQFLFCSRPTVGEKTKVRSPNLVISKGNFSHNTNGGIFLGGQDAGMVEIQLTEVRNSPQNGLSTAFSYINSLKLLNCQFVRNKVGIRLSSFSGNVHIENTKASNSTENGLYVDTNGEKTIHIENGGFFHSNGYGLYLDGRYTKVKLSATRTFFGWNKASSVYSRVYYGCSLPCSSHTIFTNCTFYANRGPVVDINESPHSNPWQFDGNFFLNNTQGPVILTTQDTHDSYTPELFLRNNYFLFNFCQDKSVIDIKGGTKVLIMEGNVFEKNYGRSIFLEKTSPSGATIRSNVFTDNKCLNSGVIEIQRMDKDILIVDNTFTLNKGLSMVFLHCEYVVGGNTPSGMKNVTFSNNSLISNVDVSLNSPTCEVRISGFMEWRTFFVNNNRFRSVHFSKELCVNTFASSHSSAIQASLNFWGYDDEEKIMERIFDAEDNYEHTFADFRPYISSAGNTVEGSPENMTRSGLTKSFLGGRI
ncbi:Scavenger receptor cysteine-rich type 1 protein M130, partial [Stylophora pistillata]